MRDPAREKNGNTGLSEISRVIQISTAMKIVTDMIKRHNNDHNASQKIDGSYAFVFNRREWNRYGT